MIVKWGFKPTFKDLFLLNKYLQAQTISELFSVHNFEQDELCMTWCHPKMIGLKNDDEQCKCVHEHVCVISLPP